MRNDDAEWRDGGTDSEPVFAGLRETGITGREIARALKISPASVSKWRRGHTSIPPDIQIFLTLMLAEQVERLGDLYAGWGAAPGAWHLSARARLDLARDALADQERRNRLLPGAAVCDGARRFRVWWNADRIVTDLAARPAPAVRAETPAGV
ncbi:MAG: hypothetical protein VW405_11705 [Rhodospirillaceae bacterium]